jgi:transcriptional regulator with XRE-family HTH domain
MNQITAPFGDMMKRWRTSRRLSQLDLALEAQVSARHLSFIETGRARPSRQMVIQLAEALDVPLRDRNALLQAAGFAPVYRETALDAPEMAHMKSVLQFILERHEPYGAVVLDRHWNILMSNQAMGRFAPFIEDPSVGGNNVMRLTFHPKGFRPFIVNWPDVAAPLLQRLQREAAASWADTGSSDLLREMLSYPGVQQDWANADVERSSLLLPVHLKKGDVEARFFTSIATLGTAQDITLHELRIETFFPADPATEKLIRKLADS